MDVEFELRGPVTPEFSFIEACALLIAMSEQRMRMDGGDDKWECMREDLDSAEVALRRAMPPKRKAPEGRSGQK